MFIKNLTFCLKLGNFFISIVNQQDNTWFVSLSTGFSHPGAVSRGIPIGFSGSVLYPGANLQDYVLFFLQKNYLVLNLYRFKSFSPLKRSL